MKTLDMIIGGRYMAGTKKMSVHSEPVVLLLVGTTHVVVRPEEEGRQPEQLKKYRLLHAL